MLKSAQTRNEYLPHENNSVIASQMWDTKDEEGGSDLFAVLGKGKHSNCLGIVWASRPQSDDDPHPCPSLGAEGCPQSREWAVNPFKENIMPISIKTRAA